MKKKNLSHKSQMSVKGERLKAKSVKTLILRYN